MPFEIAEPPAGRHGGLPSLFSDDEWEEVRTARLRGYSWEQIHEATGRRFASVRSLENSYHSRYRKLPNHLKIRTRNLCTLPIESELAGGSAEPSLHLPVQPAGDAPPPPDRNGTSG